MKGFLCLSFLFLVHYSFTKELHMKIPINDKGDKNQVDSQNSRTRFARHVEPIQESLISLFIKHMSRFKKLENQANRGKFFSQVMENLRKKMMVNETKKPENKMAVIGKPTQIPLINTTSTELSSDEDDYEFDT